MKFSEKHNRLYQLTSIIFVSNGLIILSRGGGIANGLFGFGLCAIGSIYWILQDKVLEGENE